MCRTTPITCHPEVLRGTSRPARKRREVPRCARNDKLATSRLLLCLVMGAAIAASSRTARAAEPAGGPPEFRVAPPPALPRGPLLGALIQSGLADALDRGRIDVRGFGEVGYTFNGDHDSGDENFGRVFDNERGDHVQLDQLDLSV